MSDAGAEHVLPLRTASAPEASRAVAREFAEAIRHPARADGVTVLGLATGRTPVGVYRELVRLHREESLDFAHVVTFNLDEYMGLGPGDPGSFRESMEEHLFRHVNIHPDRINFLDGRIDEAAAADHCSDYERAIDAAGGIDLQLLGLGRSGHVGFNEPGSSRDSRTRLVDLAPVTRLDARQAFGLHEEVPSQALTMGVATILAARRLRVLAFGASKCHVVRSALGAPLSTETPATFLRLHPDAVLWADPEALRLDTAGSDRPGM